jgi:hypothetical protein
MKNSTVFFLPIFFIFSGCYSGESKQKVISKTSEKAEKSTPADESANSVNWENISPSGKTIETRLPVPPGFQRQVASPNSIGNYLRKLPLKPHGSAVLLYDGSEKGFQDAQIAVIDMEIGKRDLQQCADAIMRLRAEYLFQQKKFNLIHFNFTSGDRADYLKYAEGYRTIINGNSVSWQKKSAASNSYKTFRQYLDLVFTYAGTASLEKELQPIKSFDQIEVGDVLIQGGHPGHGIMVVDVAQNPKTGQKIYLLAQSYMPAQEIHILKNPSDKNLSPWYSANAKGEINTPEWTFYPSQLKRFSNW